MNTLSSTDINAYLDRLDIKGPLPTDPLAALDLLHRQHSFQVPFENLDILLGHVPSLDPQQLLQKIVHDRRGGYCFEVNGLLYAVLQTLGYEVSCLSARILFGSKQVFFRGHQLLRVSIGGTAYIADVGYRNGILAPLRLVGSEVVRQYSETFRLLRRGGEWVLQKVIGTDWHDLYSFTEDPWLPLDFAPHNYYNATAQESFFKHLPILLRKTPEGHHAVVGAAYSKMQFGQKQETAIPSPRAFEKILQEVFGLELPQEAVAQLLPETVT